MLVHSDYIFFVVKCFLPSLPMTLPSIKLTAIVPEVFADALDLSPSLVKTVLPFLDDVNFKNAKVYKISHVVNDITIPIMISRYDICM
jgi:hypothetical protein